MINEAQATRETLSRTLADRLIATLDDRPFVPSASQLAWVDGGDLGFGADASPRIAEAAGRYADLLVHHVIGDVSVDGAPGAYFRIWQCARQAFLESLAGHAPPDSATSSWENEGGASVDVGPTGRSPLGAVGEHVAPR